MFLILPIVSCAFLYAKSPMWHMRLRRIGSGSCLLAVDSGNMAVILLKYLPADPSITSTKYPVVSTIQPEQHVHVIEEK